MNIDDLKRQVINDFGSDDSHFKDGQNMFEDFFDYLASRYSITEKTGADAVEADIVEAIKYFCAKDDALSKGFRCNYYQNSCPPEIRRVIVSALLEKIKPTEKTAEYALKPFKGGFKDGINGQTFTLNREQVAIITAAITAQKQGWMPIETAPKDGTDIYATRVDLVIFRPAIIYFEQHENKGWLCSQTHTPVKSQPTVWQPLPPAPDHEEK